MSNRIPVKFHTNIDAKYITWYFPKEVCCRPQIGDRIKPTNGDQVLKICDIQHAEDKLGNPYLYIELTKGY